VVSDGDEFEIRKELLQFLLGAFDPDILVETIAEE